MSEIIARMACRERCAMVGDVACWEIDGKLTPECHGPDDLDCEAIGKLAALIASEPVAALRTTGEDL